MTVYHKDKTLPNRFKECRLAANLSQRKLSSLLGVAPNGTTIRYYEQRKRIPNIPTLINMSTILNVAIDYLLCLDDYKSHQHYAKEIIGLNDETIQYLLLLSSNDNAMKKINDYIKKGLIQW